MAFAENAEKNLRIQRNFAPPADNGEWYSFFGYNTEMLSVIIIIKLFSNRMKKVEKQCTKDTEIKEEQQ